MAGKLWVGSFVPGVAFTRIDALSPKRLIKRVGVRVRFFWFALGSQACRLAKSAYRARLVIRKVRRKVRRRGEGG